MAITISPFGDDFTAAFNALIANSAEFDSRITILEGAVVAATYGNPPGAPTAVTAVGGIDSAVVSWTAPLNTGNSAITTYTVTAIDSSGNTDATAAFSATTGTVYGLSADTYTFTVVATNQGGNGPVSAPSAATAVIDPPPSATVPDAPTGVSALGQTTQAFVYFTPPANNGGAPITSYIASVASGPTTTATGTGSVSPVLVSGLAAGSYTFNVVAVNSSGQSAVSAASGSVTVTPVYTAPGAPTTVTTRVYGTSVDVSFVAPANTGNSAITGYTATTAGQAVVTQSGTSSPLTFNGLAAGSYTVTIVATNAYGTSVASTSASFTIVGAVTGTNLIPADAASAAYGLGGIRSLSTSGAAPTLAMSTSTYRSASPSVQATTTTVASPFFVGEKALVAVTAGTTISGLVSVQLAATGTVAPQIDWYSGGQTGSNVNAVTLISGVQGSPVAATGGAWVDLAMTTTVPSGITYAQIRGNVTSTPTVGAVAYFDNFEIAAGTVTSWTAGTGAANLVTNPSAVTDTSGTNLTADHSTLAVSRITGITPAADTFNSTTAYQVGRATATTADTYANITLGLTAPASITVGSKIVVSLWAKAASGTPFSFGMTIANAAFSDKPSTDNSYPYIADANWHQYSYSTTATHAGYSDDLLFIVLPLSGVFQLQITEATISSL